MSIGGLETAHGGLGSVYYCVYLYNWLVISITMSVSYSARKVSFVAWFTVLDIWAQTQSLTKNVWAHKWLAPHSYFLKASVTFNIKFSDCPLKLNNVHNVQHYQRRNNKLKIYKDNYDWRRQNMNDKLEKDGHLFQAVWFIRLNSFKH